MIVLLLTENVVTEPGFFEIPPSLNRANTSETNNAKN